MRVFDICCVHRCLCPRCYAGVVGTAMRNWAIQIYTCAFQQHRQATAAHHGCYTQLPTQAWSSVPASPSLLSSSSSPSASASSSSLSVLSPGHLRRHWILGTGAAASTTRGCPHEMLRDAHRASCHKEEGLAHSSGAQARALRATFGHCAACAQALPGSGTKAVPTRRCSTNALAQERARFSKACGAQRSWGCRPRLLAALNEISAGPPDRGWNPLMDLQ